MAQTAARLVDHVIPHVPVRQWVLIGVMRLPIPLRLPLAAQLGLVTPVLQVVHRVITRHLPGQAGRRVDEAIDIDIDADVCQVTCIPNGQHQSVQMRLAAGLLRYEDSGLLDRTPARWFTRVTMIEIHQQAVWGVESGLVRRIPQGPPAALLDGVSAIARAGGADPEQAVQDDQVFQYLFKAVLA